MPRQRKMSGKSKPTPRQMKEMLECPVDAFLGHYSPFLPDDTLVEAAKRALIEKQLLFSNTQNQLEWQEFDEEPRRLSLETNAFKPLEAIADVFDNGLEGLDGRQRHFSYCDCPNAEVKSEIGSSNFKTDAYFTGEPNGAQNKYIISSEAAVVAEFKKFTKDYKDNREKLVSCASFIMNDDPRRNWIYGITIENTKMAIWYFSRSHSVKCKTFDFMTKLIRVFLSFIYATREEMGYDPTVHRVHDNGLRYVYEIPNETGTRYFKTIDLLFHRKVLCITGRKTRVWSAIEVRGSSGNAMYEKVEGDKKVALKDVWLDEGSRTEKQNLDAIFECLSTVEEEAYQWITPPLHAKLKTVLEKKDYKRYFMDIVCDSFALAKSKAQSGQATPAPGILRFNRRSYLDGGDRNGVESRLSANSARERLVEDPSKLTGSTQTAASTYSEQKIWRNLSDLKVLSEPKLYKTKQHYRLVYEEVGQSLDRVDSLGTAFTAVSDAYIALVLMYLAGWMHRDVSAGNIIVVKRGNGELGGKLSDLEFAKHCKDESGSSNPKTGTPFFMPAEIHSGVVVGARTPFDWDMARSGQIPSRRSTGPQLRDRPQHGVESLWWVKLYLLVYWVDYPAGNVFANLVFMNCPIPSLERRQLFEYSNQVLLRLQEYLHPGLQHHPIPTSMQKIRDILYASYLLEKPDDPKYMGILYGHVFGVLDELVDMIKTDAKGVEFRFSNYVKVPKKRGHAEAPSKPRDDDEYKNEEEGSSSDLPVPKKTKQARTVNRR